MILTCIVVTAPLFTFICWYWDRHCVVYLFDDIDWHYSILRWYYDLLLLIQLSPLLLLFAFIIPTPRLLFPLFCWWPILRYDSYTLLPCLLLLTVPVFYSVIDVDQYGVTVFDVDCSRLTVLTTSTSSCSTQSIQFIQYWYLWCVRWLLYLLLFIVIYCVI